MKRRTWLASVAAVCVGAIVPWKQKKAVSQDKRIRKLLKETAEQHPEGYRSFVCRSLEDADIIHVFWDECQPDSDGWYSTGCVAIRESVAQDMSDRHLRRRLLSSAIVAVSEGVVDRVGMLEAKDIQPEVIIDARENGEMYLSCRR